MGKPACIASFSALLNAAFDAGFLVRDSGEIEHLNKAAHALFEIEGDASLQQIRNPLHISSYITLVDGEDSIAWEEFLKGFKNTPDRTWKSFGWRTSGVYFAAELQSAVVGEGLIALFVRKVDNDKLSVDFTNMLRGLSEASKDPVFVVNEKGRIRLVNAEATRSIGCARDDLIGNNISVIVGDRYLNEERNAILRSLESTEKPPTNNKHKLMVRRKNGTEFAAEISFREVETTEERLFCGLLHDCTWESRQDEKIKKQEEYTSQIIDASYTAMCAADRDGQIIRVNAAAVQTFGWDRDELCTKSMSDILTQKHSRVFSKEVAQFLNFGIPLTSSQEIDAVKKDGRVFPASMAIACLENNDSFVIFVQDLTTQKQLMKVEIDKTAADMLLSNMLPEKIAKELKKNPSHIADHHEAATTLFADIVGFTGMSSQMTPQEVIAMLNELFSMFDALVDKYDLNKIKTIGDCYMVSSVPVVKHDENACSRVCYFALEMLDAIGEFNAEHSEYNLNLRIGINTGPVMAGVVGCTRFMYDIWGDSVNMASRMESTGVPGRIQVTEAVVKAAVGSFEFEPRGVVDVKGKGEVLAFFLGKSLRKPILRKKKAVKNGRAGPVQYDSVQHLLTSVDFGYATCGDCASWGDFSITLDEKAAKTA